MTTICADELQPGDIASYGGRSRRIARIVLRDGWAWPVATDDSGWAIALGRQLVAVLRPAA